VIRGLLHPAEGSVAIFDVGGDDVGARVLASLRTSLGDGKYEMWQVINAKRPFTDTMDGCLAMRRAIKTASRLSVTGLLINSHLIFYGTAGGIVPSPDQVAEKICAALGVPA
jgi:hypothetical protein